MAKELRQTPDTSDVNTRNMAQAVEEMHQTAESHKKSFARRWYDNNFFDDGHHFRHIHRTTGRIVDLSKRGTIWAPKRAIPKASRQIRGIANLLMSFDFHPTIYPEKVNIDNYIRKEFKGVPVNNFGPEVEDPVTGEMIKDPNRVEFEQAMEMSKDKASKIGHWIEEEWRRQRLTEDKLPLMVMLALKNSVSFMQVWVDHVSEDIETQVYDAFDIDIMGMYNTIEESPFIGKVIPKMVREIQANEFFDEEKRMKVMADNRFAASDIKEAYLMSKYGYPKQSKEGSTALMHEYFIKETLNDNNLKKISKQENSEMIMRSREKGDTVIRHVFTASGHTLRDQYISSYHYPFVDFRMEPGPIYQVPQIERFISLNKSYDSIMSRLERYFHTMNVGMWVKRQGEAFKINNRAGGQVVSYKGLPPTQARLSPIPSYVFNMLTEIKEAIEEQGVTTTTLGKIPKGVKANAAIESLKASEVANMTMPIKQTQRTITEISKRFIELAGDNFVIPREVEILEAGEPNYFQIMGSEGLRLSKKLKTKVKQDMVILDRDRRVRVDVEGGSGYTIEGKRENMLDLSRFLLELQQAGIISPEAVKVAIKRLIETYKFGSVSEFMAEIDTLEAAEGQQGPEGEDRKMIDNMKIAVVEAFQDLQAAQGGQPPPAPQGV